MRIILSKDVKNVGKKGEIVEVSDGYASNFIIPKGFGRKLTSESLTDFKKEKAEEAAEFQRKTEEAQQLAKRLDSLVLEFQAMTGKDGVMIGSISTKQIEQELKTKHSIIIDKRKFVDHYPCNAFGTTNLRIELFKGVIGTIHVHITEKKK